MKTGFNRAGSRRFICGPCGRMYTPEPRRAGYDESVREQALRLYAGYMSIRRAAKCVGVNHQTVANRVDEAYAIWEEAEAAGKVPGSLIAQVGVRRTMALQEKEWRW